MPKWYIKMHHYTRKIKLKKLKYFKKIIRFGLRPFLKPISLWLFFGFDSFVSLAK